MARSIKYLTIHCSAGFGDRKAIEKFWKQSLGWKSPGYHRLIDEDGTIHNLSDFNLPTNGVKGFNANSIHISYIGGVDKKDYAKAVDTRTPQQKQSIIKCIYEALAWIRTQGQDVSKIEILGHRDFSPDKNGNGIVDAWERIKQCPSYNAIPEYNKLISHFLK
jgi:N-acetylmuramoyl-L-alanine amidase